MVPIVGSILLSVGVKLGVRLLASAVKGLADHASSAQTRAGSDFGATLAAATPRDAGAPVPSAPAPAPELVSHLAFEHGLRGVARGVQSRLMLDAYRRLGPPLR